MNKTFVTLFFLICSIPVLANPLEVEAINKEKRVSLVGGIVNNLKYEGGIKRNILYNNWKRVLDVYYDKESTSTDHPVVILVHGGGWVSGDKVKYTDVASYFVEQGYVAVVPDYILFPYGRVEDMIEDVYKSIEWTFDNISKYGGDSSNVSIISHSAGAHLTALALIKSSLNLSNNGKVLKTLPLLKSAVLMNGPYDFDVYESYVRSCEEDVDNGLVERFAELLLGSNQSSPTDIVRDFESSFNSNIGAKTLNIVSCRNDTVIPMASATGLVDELKKTNTTSKVNYFLIEDGGHAYIIDGIMNRETTQCNLILDYLHAE